MVTLHHDHPVRRRRRAAGALTILLRYQYILQHCCMNDWWRTRS
jgi:hypothetical protein